MKKLYTRSPLWFSLAAIAVYVGIIGNIRANLGDGSAVMLVSLAVLTALFWLFLRREGLLEHYGLTFWPDSRKFLFFIPFLLLGFMNLVLGIKPHFDLMTQVCAMVSMALVGFLEELIFRGFLFRAIEPENHRRALIISAVTFGAGHIVNLLTGQAAPDTFLQIGYAIAIGFAFVLVFDRSGSLWPCIVTHSLIDMTSTLSNAESPAMPLFDIVGSIFIVVLCSAYCLYIVRKIPRK